VGKENNLLYLNLRWKNLVRLKFGTLTFQIENNLLYLNSLEKIFSAFKFFQFESGKRK